MAASLADTRLSLSLRIWNAGTTPIQASARLRLTLSSPLDITIRTASPTRTNDPGEHGGDKGKRENPDAGVMIAVEAAPGTSTVQTDYLGDEITCTITYDLSEDPLPTLRPSGCRHLSVLIGLQMSGEGVEY
jgi:hypothetical protein